MICKIQYRIHDMAARREDCDLWLVLTDPQCAREFIAKFDWNCPPEFIPDHVIVNDGEPEARKILFKNMTDEDAVVAAAEILRAVQIPQEMREKQIHEDLGEIH
jgi:hypothetical protein